MSVVLVDFLQKQSILSPAGVLETKEAPFVLWDTPGWSINDTAYARDKLGYILDGNLPNHFDLSGRVISRQDCYFNTEPGQADKVHCMCIVVPCGFSSYSSTYMDRIRDIKECAKDRGEPPPYPFGTQRTCRLKCHT